MFVVRTYPKAELAMLYCPHSTPENAMKNLRRWIDKCTDLRAELQKKQYNPRRHTFFKAEVAAIIKYLGEP